MSHAEISATLATVSRLCDHAGLGVRIWETSAEKDRWLSRLTLEKMEQNVVSCGRIRTRTDRVDWNAVTIAAIADLWPQARDCLHSSANDAVAHYILYGLRV